MMCKECSAAAEAVHEVFGWALVAVGILHFALGLVCMRQVTLQKDKSVTPTQTK
jgi:thiosulfate reductase cytochrome b subunit